MVPGEGFDMVLCPDAGTGGGLFFAAPGTYRAEEMAFMLAHAGEHPAARAFSSGVSNATTISDCASIREWKNSRLYWEGATGDWASIMKLPLHSRAWRRAALRRRYPQLSVREAEILFWIVKGKQNAEIAVILERRLTTVQEHVENLVRKLGMENRHQMTVEVLRTCWGIKA